jgi:hypothetical protein
MLSLGRRADTDQRRELLLNISKAWLQAALIMKAVLVPEMESKSLSAHYLRKHSARTRKQGGPFISRSAFAVDVQECAAGWTRPNGTDFAGPGLE